MGQGVDADAHVIIPFRCGEHGYIDVYPADNGHSGEVVIVPGWYDAHLLAGQRLAGTASFPLARESEAVGVH